VDAGLHHLQGKAKRLKATELLDLLSEIYRDKMAMRQRHVAAAHHPELVGRLGEAGEIAEIDLRDGRRNMALQRCEQRIQRLGRQLDARLHEVGDEPAQLVAEDRWLGFVTGKL
jgi:hypothetical protein